MSVDWVLDGAQYNEWMNEEDYELEENGKLKVGPRTGHIQYCSQCCGAATFLGGSGS